MPTIQTATDFIARLLAAQKVVDGRSEASTIRAEQARDRSIVKFRQDVAMAIAALAAGEIANPVYQDLKFTLDRRMDEARNVANVYEFFYFHQMAGRLKRTTNETERQFLVEVMPLADLVLALKPLAVKRKPKAHEDVQTKYLAPRAGIDAAAMVQKALMQVTDAAYQGLFDTTLSAYHRMVANFRTFAAERPEMTSYAIRRAYHANGRNMNALHLLQTVSDATGAALDTELRAIAKREVDHVRDQFLIKNLKKLDSIVERKGDFAEIIIIGHHFSMERLEGNFRIVFKDGAQFDVSNSVETAYSIYGKRFNRFPLRFHDVRLTGGKKMAKPSEERMNTVFVGREDV